MLRYSPKKEKFSGISRHAGRSLQTRGAHLDENDKTREFDAIAMPHLDAAYNLARWLTRNDHQAEDLVQNAFLRAFRFFDGFRGDDARAWLLTIVRNTYFTSLREERHEHVQFDEELFGAEERGADGRPMAGDSAGIGNPEEAMMARDRQREVNRALEKLPPAFREVIVLKEMNDLSYKEIADIAGVPLGTVMSRLARARKMLGEFLKGRC
ncbi:MAG TPA: sigma-70 family RNA polymerase sigma factor [Burkholderiaceae bacterium]